MKKQNLIQLTFIILAIVCLILATLTESFGYEIPCKENWTSFCMGFSLLAIMTGSSKKSSRTNRPSN